MTTPCCGLAGRLFGHKFKPRYDETEEYPDGSAKQLETALQRITGRMTVTLPDDVAALNAVTEGFRQISDTETFYVQDVCVRCGLIVERPQDPIETVEAEELLKDVIERVKDTGPFERAKLMSTVAELASLMPSTSLAEAVRKADEKKVACPKCFLVFAVGATCPDTMICPKCATQFSTVVKA